MGRNLGFFLKFESLRQWGGKGKGENACVILRNEGIKDREKKTFSKKFVMMGLSAVGIEKVHILWSRSELVRY